MINKEHEVSTDDFTPLHTGTTRAITGCEMTTEIFDKTKSSQSVTLDALKLHHPLETEKYFQGKYDDC